MSGQLEKLNGRCATLALPFDAPRVVEINAGLTLEEIIETAFAEGLMDRAWAPGLVCYLDDSEIPREAWARTVPLPGQLLSIRARPGEITSILALAWQVVQQIAIAAAVNAVLKAFTPDPRSEAQEQVYDITGGSNEKARWRTVPAVLGSMRAFPPYAADGYTEAVGEKVYLRLLFCWGLGPLQIEPDTLKIGDTPISSFAGVSVQHRLKPSDPWPSLFPSSADQVEGPGEMEYADGWVERSISVGAAGGELQAELFWLEGLIRYKDDGSHVALNVEYRVRYRLESEPSTWRDFNTGAPASEGAYFNPSKRTRKPFRETHRRSVAGGDYRVAVKRVSLDPEHPNVRNRFAYAWLRSLTYEKAVTDDNMAVTAVRIEAGEQLNGVVDLFNGVVTRLCPKWDAGTETWGAEGPSSNPAELARWIDRGPGNVRPRDANGLDDAAYGAWAELCTARDWRCDMTVLAGAGLDEIRQTVARCGRATIGERAGKLVPVIDDLQPTAVQLFTPRNSWGFRSQRRYPDDVHAFKAEFQNAEKGWARDEMVVYFDGYDFESAELIETVATPGKTRPVEVYRDVRRAMAERILRQEEYFWNADIEHLASTRGQRVKVAHYVIAVGRKSARVKARVLNGGGTHVTALVLDEQIAQTPGDTYGLEWRKIAGADISVETLPLTNTGVTTNTATLASALLLANAPDVDDLVTFGDLGEATLDLVIADMPSATDLEASFAGLAYTGDLYSDDDATLPEWSSSVSGDAFPGPPAPEIQSVTAGPEGIFVSFTFPAATADRVSVVEQYMKPLFDDGATFDQIATLPGTARQAAFPAGDPGKSYVLRLVSIGARDRRAASEEINVASQAQGPALSLLRDANLSLVGRTLTKESGSAAWDTQAYSVDVYVGACYATARPLQTNAAIMFGLTTDPAASAGFSTIDFAWHTRTDGTYAVYENGVQVWTSGDTHAEADVFSVVYDNAQMRYLRNGVVKYASAPATNLALHFDSSFNTVGGALGSVAFGPSGRTATKQETRYKRSVAPPSTPTGDDPSGWTIGVPSGSEALWSSIATKTQAGVLIGVWQTPVLMTSPNPRGAYSAGTQYYTHDSVTFNGGTYFAKTNTLGNAPSGTAEENTWWSVIAAPGAPGAPGDPPSGFTATIDLVDNVGGVTNLRTIANANGYTGASDATITFEAESGIDLWGAPGDGGIAIDSGTWPTGSYAINLTLTLKSGSKVYGGGGNGGNGAVSEFDSITPGFGGDAIYCRVPMTININSGAEVKAGGDGGYGGGLFDPNPFDEDPPVGIGGGGGGGFPNGAGGGGYVNGGDGTSSGGGAGGGGLGDGSGGGNGGNAGQFGTKYAVRKNGHSVTVNNSGGGGVVGTIG